MRLFFIVILLLFIAGCTTPEPRRPVSVKTGSSFDASVERNKKMLEREQEAIKIIIENDSLNTWHASSGGFWYRYHNRDSVNNYTPRKSDLVFISYDIRTLNNNALYTKKQIGRINVKIDSDIIFPGLNSGLKLMKKGETVTFLFPSPLAYGYHGDGHSIGVNVPIISTVSLIDIIKDPNTTILN